MYATTSLKPFRNQQVDQGIQGASLYTVSDFVCRMQTTVIWVVHKNIFKLLIRFLSTKHSFFQINNTIIYISHLLAFKAQLYSVIGNILDKHRTL